MIIPSSTRHERAYHTLLRAALETLDKQALASHVLGLRQSHGRKDCRSDVSKDAPSALEGPVFGRVGHDKRDPATVSTMPPITMA